MQPLSDREREMTIKAIILRREQTSVIKVDCFVNEGLLPAPHNLLPSIAFSSSSYLPVPTKKALFPDELVNGEADSEGSETRGESGF